MGISLSLSPWRGFRLSMKRAFRKLPFRSIVGQFLLPSRKNLRVLAFGAGGLNIRHP